MSSVAWHASPHRDRRLSSLTLRALEFLHARILRQRALEELEKLSDRDLRDIGLERRDIAARIDAGMNSIGLRTLRR